jgi:hypothetical protein
LNAVLSDIHWRGVGKKKEDEWLIVHRNIAVIAAAAWPLSFVVAAVHGVVVVALWLAHLIARLSRMFTGWVRYGDAPKSPNAGGE